MKKTLWTAGVITLVFLTVGCTKIVTNFKPYNQYVKKPLTLMRPMTLVQEEYVDRELLFYLPQGAFHALLNPDSKSNSSAKIWNLPVGTPLTLNKVETKIGDGWSDIVAFGEIEVPQINKKLAFSYSWGYFTPYLNRAPWETSDVPEKRYVGFYGNAYGKPDYYAQQQLTVPATKKPK